VAVLRIVAVGMIVAVAVIVALASVIVAWCVLVPTVAVTPASRPRIVVVGVLVHVVLRVEGTVSVSVITSRLTAAVHRRGIAAWTCGGTRRAAGRAGLGIVEEALTHAGGA
jgi:hypothetical protein